jgi:hypothetical protein
MIVEGVDFLLKFKLWVGRIKFQKQCAVGDVLQGGTSDGAGILGISSRKMITPPDR